MASAPLSISPNSTHSISLSNTVPSSNLALTTHLSFYFSIGLLLFFLIKKVTKKSRNNDSSPQMPTRHRVVSGLTRGSVVYFLQNFKICICHLLLGTLKT